MSKLSITPDKLAKALGEQLTLYHEDILERLREVTRETTVKLVRKTRQTAPKQTGEFSKHISGDFRGLARGISTVEAVWYVKPPHHRLTHLLVNGHQKADGGRVDGDPFLADALDELLPEFEQAIEEAIKGD